MGYQFLSNFKYSYNAFSLEFDEGVTFKNGNASTLFDYCYGFEPTQPLNVPDGTTNCYRMFGYCNNMNQPVYIPEGVNNIAEMFYGCKMLDQDMYVPYHVNGNSLFGGCANFNSWVDFDDNIDTLRNTFLYCSNFNQNLILPMNIQHLPYTFRQCYNFDQNLYLPYGIDTMGYTFQNCNNFNQNLYVPNSVTSMNGTFAGCTNFDQDIVLPDSLIYMGATFSGCSSLSYNIQIPDSVVHTSSAFMQCSSYNYCPTLPSGLVEATSMFAGCGIFDQHISLPSGVRYISGMFRGCNIFNQNIAIPSSVVSAVGIFQDCPNLNQSIEMRVSSLTSADSAFMNCVNYSAPIHLSPNCYSVENIAAHTKVRSVTLTASHYNFNNLVGIFNTIDEDYHLSLGSLNPSTYDINNEQWIIGDVLHHLTMPANATIYNSIYRQNYPATTVGSPGQIEAIFGAYYYKYNGYIYQPQTWEEYNGSSYWRDNKRASILRASCSYYNAETGNCIAFYHDWANATYNSLTNQMDAPKYACVITLV